MRGRGAPIQHGGNRAFYRPSTDSIRLPPREAFIGAAAGTAAEAYAAATRARSRRAPFDDV